VARPLRLNRRNVPYSHGMALPVTCPRCGADLELGSITGQAIYLNWTPDGDKPGFVTVGKEHLATGSIATPPMLDAGRCPACGLGVFEVPSES
jgi:Domain of unknown function (DUF6487)